MLRVREIMSRDLVTVAPDLSLREAMELLSERHVSGAPVVSGQSVVGVISLTDLATFAAQTPEGSNEQSKLNWFDLGASGTAEDGEWNEDLGPSAKFFYDQRLSENVDLDTAFAELAGSPSAPFEDTSVSEVMSRSILSIGPETPVEQAADIMRRSGVHRILVVQNGELLGLVTTTDVASAVADHKLTSRTFVFNQVTGFDGRDWP